MEELDLDLWRDQQIIKKQNRLKAQMWTIFSQLGNSLSTQPFVSTHPKSKGVKLTKGNDLLGFPYHVFDLFRDFDPKRGANIRLLNWFGHGIYLLAYVGADLARSLSVDFYSAGLQFALTADPFDYPGMILENQWVKSSSPSFAGEGLQVWLLPMSVSSSPDALIQSLEKEIIKLIDILEPAMGY